MASMFGGFDFIGQVVQGSPGPGGAPGGTGGFPGIFPGGGVANSGWAGFGQGTYGPVGPCTSDDLKTGRCVMGPRMELMGNR